MPRGRLITIEGLDGAGKTTLAAGLERELAARGRAVRTLREPGGVELAERVRDLVKDSQLRIGDRAEAPDRLEREDEIFFAAIATGYDRLAAADPERVRVIDAAAPSEQVLAAAIAELADLLPG